MDKVQAALKYLENGFCPLPVVSETKRPAIKTWAEFGERLPTEAEIHGWWDNNPDWDIALLSGHGGLVFVDVDVKGKDKEVGTGYVQKVKENIPNYSVMVETPSGGLHIWLKEVAPSTSHRMKGEIGQEVPIDIKADRKGYVVAPPSKGYKFICHGEKGIQDVGNGEMWARRFFQVPEPPYAMRIRKPYEDVFEGKTLEEGSRDETLVSVAGKLHSLPGMSDTMKLDILLAINERRCNPPLEEAQIMKIVKSTGRYERPPEPKKSEPISNIKLARSMPPKQDWLVEGLIPKASTTVVAAPPGSYKTYLMFEMMYARSDGKYLGKFPTSNDKKSLFLDGENGEAELWKRVHQLRSNAKDYGEIFYCWYVPGVILTDKFAMEVIKRCKDLDCDTVVIDPYRQFMGGAEEDSKDASEFCRVLTMFHGEGIATQVLHHPRKTMQGDIRRDPEMDDLRGSGALAAHAASILHVQQTKEGVKVVQSKSRYAERRQPFAVAIENTDRGMHLKYVGTSISEVFDEQGKAAQDILYLLEEKDMYRGDIISKLKNVYSVSTVERALKTLVEEKQITKTKIGNAMLYSLPKRDIRQELPTVDTDKEMSIDDVSSIYGT